MNKPKNTNKTWLVALFVTAFLVASVITFQDNFVVASGDHHKKKSNEGEQGISQIQDLGQSASVSSGGDNLESGNNIGFLLNLNKGDPTVGQQ